MSTLEELLKYGRQQLFIHGIEQEQSEAWLFLEEACQISRSRYYAQPDSHVTKKAEETYKNWIEKRCTRIPLQQILGKAWFYGLTFAVNEHVLIPRQDTECLVEEVLKRIQENDKILDMCTGSGCILLTLLHEKSSCQGVGVDISSHALVIAKENGRHLQIPAVFLESNLFECVEGVYDVIVSNPPYIPSGEIASLMEEVRGHEPLQALDGSGDGLYFYREIIKEAGNYLKQGGWLCFEIGHDQGIDLKNMMCNAGYGDVEIIKDLAGLDRVAVGRLE